MEKVFIARFGLMEKNSKNEEHMADTAALKSISNLSLY